MPSRFAPALSSAAALVFVLLVLGSADATTAAKKSAKSTAHRAPASEIRSPAETLAPGDTLVAKVGKRNITLAGFRDEWARLQPNQKPQAPDPVVAYKIFLGDLVSRELLSQEAERVGSRITPAQEKDIQSFWETQTKNQLFVEDVENKVQVDTTNIERFRTQLTRILYLTAYVFPTQEQAQAWYTRIVSGTPISRLEAAAKAGGEGAPQMIDLGHKIREDFNTETANTIFALAPGRLSTPVPASSGWALIQLVSWRVRPNGIASANKEAVIREMKRLAAISYKEVYRDSLAKAVHIVYREAAMDTIVNRFLLIRDRTVPNDVGGGTFNMFQPMPVFLPGDSALVLATSTLGQVTGHDLYRFLAGMNEMERPEVRSADQLRPWVDRVAFDQLLLKSALAKGYDKKPRVVREVTMRRDKYRAEQLYADSIATPIKISEKEAQAVYASDTTRWMEQENARIWVCAAATKAQGDSLIRAGQSGGNLKEIAYNFTQLGEHAEDGGMLQPFTREQCPFPAATDAIFKTPAGSFGGPIAENEGWIIFKVLEHRPTRMRPFAEVHDDVVRAMRNDREEAAMQLFLERLRKRYGVELHEEWLAKMAGTPASPPASSMSGKTP